MNCRFTRAQAEQLDKIKQWSRALDGSDYLPGMVSLHLLLCLLALHHNLESSLRYFSKRYMYSCLSVSHCPLIIILVLFQVGINNIKENDFVNVTIQSLMRVTPLRNFFLLPENYKTCRSPLVQRFGELTKKIWHTRNFKGQVCISVSDGSMQGFRLIIFAFDRA